MKKLMSTVLVIALLTCMATPAFAAGSEEDVDVKNEDVGIIVVNDIPEDEYDLEEANEDEFVEASDGNDNELSPRGIEHITYYTLKNKKLIGTTYGMFHKYITTTWAKATGYTVSKSTTIGLSTQSTTGAFPVSFLKGLPGFNGSITASVATNIYADKNRESKLTLTKDIKKYSGDYYYVIEFASGNISETKKGSGTILDPFDSHYVVIYDK